MDDSLSLSFRDVLLSALTQARHAVELDSSNTNVRGAIEGYQQCINLISDVIAAGSGTDNGQEDREAAQLDNTIHQAEVERLRMIRESYRKRVQVLRGTHRETARL